jgi:hypothetical protein
MARAAVAATNGTPSPVHSNTGDLLVTGVEAALRVEKDERIRRREKLCKVHFMSIGGKKCTMSRLLV